MNQPLQLGAVVVCGGTSRRMGYPKAELPWGNKLIIRHVCDVLSNVAQPIVAAGYVGNALTGTAVIIAQDHSIDRGPMEGLRVGLAELAKRGTDAAFVTACDAPLIRPSFVAAIAGRLRGYQAVVPVAAGRMFPLAAVFRTDIHDLADQMIHSDQLSLHGLVRRLEADLVDCDELRAVDPLLASLENFNSPAAYLAALRRHGLPPPPEEILRRLGKSG